MKKDRSRSFFKSATNSANAPVSPRSSAMAVSLMVHMRDGAFRLPLLPKRSDMSLIEFSVFDLRMITKRTHVHALYYVIFSHFVKILQHQPAPFLILQYVFLLLACLPLLKKRPP